MRVLFVGTPGVSKKLALEKLREAVQELFPQERIFAGENRRTVILDELLYGQDAITFLQQTEETQKKLWRETFHRIREDFDTARREHHFLGLHLTYRLGRLIPFCVASFPDLIAWKPDVIITFIDDIYCVRGRVHEREYKSFTLADLILWRSEEILVGDLLARVVNPQAPPPNYVVSVKHPASMLARLLMQKDTMRVYLSHDITKSRTDERLRKVIDSFRIEIRKRNSCAVFEPLTIDELPPVKLHLSGTAQKVVTYNSEQPSLRWPTLQPDDLLASDHRCQIQIPSTELHDVEELIDAQVSWRDIRLVNQSHCVLVYRPTIAGTIGSGVLSEIDYARSTGRPVIVYINKDEDPPLTSPFLRLFTDPGSNPNYINEPTEEKLWTRMNQLSSIVRADRDHFLK
jgi:hypothetical protein